MIKTIVPARMPGCAKKLAVRSSPRLSIINTSLPVGVWPGSMPDIGFPVAISPLPVLSKSISLPSLPIISPSVSRFGLSTVFYKKKKR